MSAVLLALGLWASPPADWGPPVLHTTALFIGVRQAEAILWPEPFADGNFGRIFDRYEETFTRPPVFDSKAPFFQWDHDPLVVNVVGHGLMGSELYLRARHCHFGWAGSLAFAAGSTVVWEYAFEGNGVRPSALDLVYTPLSGLVLGEARYLLFRAAGSIESPTARAILSTVVDPFGELERRAMGSRC